MPGMMDTVLNLGLNDKTAAGMATATGDARFVYDSYRRFIQMYGDVVMDVDHGLFEDLLDDLKMAEGVFQDTDLSAAALQTLTESYKQLVLEEAGEVFPQDPMEQLWGAVGAVFASWMNNRAHVCRRSGGGLARAECTPVKIKWFTLLPPPQQHQYSAHSKQICTIIVRIAEYRDCRWQ